ncbi:MAG: adenylate kinase, partial [Candidatus Parcubacteria bacterium]
AIFDGFNRKVPEAELIVDSLRWLGRPFTVLNIQVSDESVLKRLALRKGVEGRADDSAVAKRLEEYKKHTEPVLDIFRKAGVLVEIDGEPTPEEIAVQVAQVVDSK